MWITLLKSLSEYSILGIIAFFFFRSYTKREDMFRDLMESSLHFHKENMVELKKAITQLSQSLMRNNEVTKEVLSDIVVEVDNLKDKYNIVTTQLIETILDEKKVSKRLFYDFVKLITINMIYKSILSFNSAMDNNGLVNNEKINILKNNVSNDIIRYKEDVFQLINDIEFEKVLKEDLTQRLCVIYDLYSEKINSNIFEKLTLENLKKDHNYFNIKQDFKNVMYEAQSELLVELKNVLNKR